MTDELGGLSSPSAEDEAARDESAMTMQAAVARMPSDLRDVYALWSTGEWSEQELADEFEVARGTIRARIARIKLYLVERVDLDTAFATGLLAPKDAP